MGKFGIRDRGEIRATSTFDQLEKVNWQYSAVFNRPFRGLEWFRLSVDYVSKIQINDSGSIYRFCITVYRYHWVHSMGP